MADKWIVLLNAFLDEVSTEGRQQKTEAFLKKAFGLRTILSPVYGTLSAFRREKCSY